MARLGSAAHDVAAVFTCWPVASWMFTRAKKLGALTVEEALARDRRQPIVYLRSFEADKADEIVRATQTVLSGVRRRGPRQSREEEIAERLSAAGPVVALGRPGEALPQLGAARVYVPDEAWQAQVKDWLGRSQLVVLRVGHTAGLVWELSEVVKRNHCENLLLHIPSAAEYKGFRAWAKGVLPKPLPSDWRGDFMAFDSEWSPRIPDAEWRHRHGMTPPA